MVTRDSKDMDTDTDVGLKSRSRANDKKNLSEIFNAGNLYKVIQLRFLKDALESNYMSTFLITNKQTYWVNLLKHD